MATGRTGGPEKSKKDLLTVDVKCEKKRESEGAFKDFSLSKLEAPRMINQDKEG